ncbi:MAG: prepilin-type N-terminal cleavage/methylation domain-containing protein [Phycisphaerales bacterium JB063]
MHGIERPRLTRHTRLSRHRRNAGFTLVEALAALMLMAVVIPLVMRGVAMSAQVGVLADRRAQATMLADTRLTEAILNGEWEEGDSAGAFDEETYGSEAETFEWFLLVDDWNGQIAFKEITLIVTWQQRGEEQHVALATVVNAEGL